MKLTGTSLNFNRYGTALSTISGVLKELGKASSEKEFNEAQELKLLCLETLGWTLWTASERRKALVVEPPFGSAVF